MGIAILPVSGDRPFADWQNSMRKLAIRIIGLGHQIVQFNFSTGDDWWPQVGEQELFLFIFRK